MISGPKIWGHFSPNFHKRAKITIMHKVKVYKKIL